MTTFPRVILISGTPGVGKTTIATSLEEKGFSVLHLNDFILKNGLYFGYDYSRESVIIDEEFVQEKLKTFLNQASGYLIIESHTAEIVPKEFVELIIVLRCEPGILKKRLELTRGYHDSKLKENMQAEIMAECLLAAQEFFPPEKIVEIDSSFLSPEQIAVQIIDLINAIKS